MDKKNKSGYPADCSKAMNAEEYRPINKGFPSKPIGEAMGDAQAVLFYWFHTILYPPFKFSSTNLWTYIKGVENAI